MVTKKGTTRNNNKNNNRKANNKKDAHTKRGRGFAVTNKVSVDARRTNSETLLTKGKETVLEGVGGG